MGHLQTCSIWFGINLWLDYDSIWHQFVVEWQRKVYQAQTVYFFFLRSKCLLSSTWLISWYADISIVVLSRGPGIIGNWIKKFDLADIFYIWLPTFCLLVQYLSLYKFLFFLIFFYLILCLIYSSTCATLLLAKNLWVILLQSLATMIKIIKEMLPPDVRVARDAQDLLVECCVGEL